MGYGPAGGVMPGGYPLGMAPDSLQDASEKSLAADSSVSAGATEEAGKGEVAQVGFEVPVEGAACPPGGACAHGGACPPGAGCGAGDPALDTQAASVAAWSIVHGFSTLLLDGRLNRFGVDVDPEKSVKILAQKMLKMLINGIEN
jgi:hypothetical protein